MKNNSQKISSAFYEVKTPLDSKKENISTKFQLSRTDFIALKKTFALPAIATALLALFALATNASANGFPTIYWVGNNGTSWGGDNWSSDSGGTTPANFVNNNYIIFSATGSSNSSATDLGGDRTISSLNINTTDLVGISGGNLTIDGTTTAAITTTLAAGNLTISAPLTLTGNATIFEIENTNTTLGSIASSNGLVKTGNGTLIFTGNNTYTGNTTISAGTLALIGNGNLGNSTISIAGGTLDMGGKSLTNILGNLTTGTLANGTLTNNGSNYNLQNGTVSATLAGTNGVNKTTSGTVTLSGSNTYNGTTSINAGTLQIGSASGLGSGGNITFGGGTLQYGSGTTADVSSRIRNSGSAIRIDTNGNEVTFSNSVNSTNTGGLAKLGSGTLTLNGNSSYTGGTFIESGTLTGNSLGLKGNITNNATLLLGSATYELDTTGTGNLLVNNNADAVLAGNATMTGGTTIDSGTLTIGNGGTTGSITGNITNNAALAFNRSNNSTYSGSITGTGTLEKLGAGALTLSGGNHTAGATTINGGGLILAASSLTANGNTKISSGNFTVGSGASFTQPIPSHPLWLSYSFIVGDGVGNTAHLNIDGGSLFGNRALIGNSTNSTGSATMNGGTWANNSSLEVGSRGNGTLLINSGNVSNSAAYIANHAGSTGLVTMNNGTWTNSDALYVGDDGNGTLFINDGSISASSLRIGNNAGSTGVLTMHNGTLSSLYSLNIGSYGNGTLNLTGGSLTGDTARIGDDNGGTGLVNVSGGNLSTTGSFFRLAQRGNGTLNLTGGTVSIQSGTGSLTMAWDANSTGILNIGNGTTAGELQAAKVASAGTGTAIVNFNHTGNHTFAPILEGTLTVNKLGNGTTTLNGTNTFTGNTTLSAGTLALGNVDALSGSTLDHSSSNTTLKLALPGANTYNLGGLSGTRALAIGNNTLSIGANNQTTTFAGAFSGTGSISKVGTGTLTLSGSNTYTGNTSISEGTLEIASTGQISHSTSYFSVAGENSTASVTLDGGKISNSDGYIGFGNGSTGTVNINSGNWTNSDNLRVGYYGNGTLNLTGGNVSNVDGIIGRYSTGVANVSGGTWSSSGSMTIGREATGTLNLTGGNVVVGSGSGNITIAQETVSTGTLNLGNGSTAGTLQAARVTGGNGTAVVNFNHTGNYSFAPILDGSLSVNKLGDGTLSLTGNNSYAGGTFIESGTLAGSSLGLKGNITNNATLLLTNGSSYETEISGIGNLLVANSAALLGNATMAGGTTIQSGTLTIGGRDSTQIFILGSIDGDITNEGALRFDMNTGNRTYSGVISGNGSLVSTSSGYGTSTGILYLTGNNTFSGGTTFSHGTLDISGGSLASTGNVTLTGGTFDIGASNQEIGGFQINGSQSTLAGGSGILTASSYDLRQGTVSLSLNGTAGLTKNSTGGSGSSYANGVVHLSGNNTATGNIAVNAGILSFNTIQSLYSGNNGSWTPDKITVSSNATSPFTSTLALGTGNGDSPTAGFNNAQIEEIFENLTANGTIGLTANSSIGFNVASGNFDLTTTITDRPDLGVIGLDKIGAGALVLRSSNTFTGPLNIFEGIVRAGTNNALSTNSSLVVTKNNINKPSNYDIGDFNQQFVNVTLLSGSLSGGNGTINATGNYTMVDGDSTANLSGVAPLNKTGYGIVFLSGNNSYTGHTTVNGSSSWSRPTTSDARLQFQTPGSLYTDDASKWNGGNITVNQYGILAVRADATGTQGFTEDRIATLITNLISANRTSGGLLAGSAFGIDTAGTNMTLSTALMDSTGQVAGGGAIGFVKYGAGTLMLNSTNNTHSLVTSVTGGTLALAPGTTISASSANLSVQNNAVLDLGTTSQTVAQVGVSSGSILGSGTLTATTGDYSFSAANITANLAGNVGASISQGTTTLGGNNTHTGNTTVNSSAVLSLANLNAVAASTLVANLGSTTQFAVPGTYNLGGLSGAGNIAFGINTPTLSIGANNQSTSYGSSTGSLSGTGSVTKVGNGTLTFAGNNNYNGGTTISEGTLALGSGGTAGSVTGDITNNAALVFNRSDNSTYSGIVSGNGSVTKNGTGLLTLSGISTYTGNTTINTGTLGLDGTLASAAISIASGAGLNTSGGISEDAAVANSGNFTVNAADTIGSLSGSGNTILNAALTTGALGTADEISGTITGNAALTKAGNGTLSLTGSATNSGGTTISAGTLSIGNGGTTGTITGNITNNAALVFNRSNNSTFTAGLTGNGSLEKLGAGVLTLANGTRTAGATTINGGGLVLANASTLNATGPVAVNTGTITIGQGGSLLASGSTTTPQTFKALLASNRSNFTIAALNLEDSNSFVTSFGDTTVTNAPAGIAFGPDGNIYVASYGTNSISIFNSAGTYTGNITSNLNQPEGLAFDSNGNLYVANFGSNSTSIFAPNGTYTGNITANLNRPTDVVFDSEGKLYISNHYCPVISQTAQAG